MLGRYMHICLPAVLLEKQAAAWKSIRIGPHTCHHSPLLCSLRNPKKLHSGLASVNSSHGVTGERGFSNEGVVGKENLLPAIKERNGQSKDLCLKTITITLRKINVKWKHFFQTQTKDTFLACLVRILYLCVALPGLCVS